MNKYLLTIIITSISIGLCNIIIPKQSGLDKSVKFIGMLIILATVLSPIIDGIKNINDETVDLVKDKLSFDAEKEKDKYEFILEDYLSDYSYDLVNDYIKNELNIKFDIASEECEVNLSIVNEGENKKISHVQVLLSGAAIFKNPYDIEQYVSSMLGAECSVYIKNRR